jgi:hypothetical protein
LRKNSSQDHKATAVKHHKTLSTHDPLAPSVAEEVETVREDLEGELGEIESHEDPVHVVAGIGPPLCL